MRTQEEVGLGIFSPLRAHFGKIVLLSLCLGISLCSVFIHLGICRTDRQPSGIHASTEVVDLTPVMNHFEHMVARREINHIIYHVSQKKKLQKKN